MACVGRAIDTHAFYRAACNRRGLRRARVPFKGLVEPGTTAERYTQAEAGNATQSLLDHPVWQRSGHRDLARGDQIGGDGGKLVLIPVNRLSAPGADALSN